MTRRDLTQMQVPNQIHVSRRRGLWTRRGPLQRVPWFSSGPAGAGCSSFGLPGRPASPRPLRRDRKYPHRPERSHVHFPKMSHFKRSKSVFSGRLCRSALRVRAIHPSHIFVSYIRVVYRSHLSESFMIADSVISYYNLSTTSGSQLDIFVGKSHSRTSLGYYII